MTLLLFLCIPLLCYGAEIDETRKLAEQGHSYAQFDLGLLYIKGNGVPEDDAEAYKWFNLAAAQGLEKAKEAKSILSKEMTKEQIAEGQKLTREWLAKHSEK